MLWVLREVHVISTYNIHICGNSEKYLLKISDDMEVADREVLQRVELSAIDPHDRHIWRFGVRSAMCAAGQPPRRIWVLPLYLHINQKSSDDDDDDENKNNT